MAVLVGTLAVGSSAVAEDPSSACSRVAIIGDSLTVGSATFLSSELTALGIHDFAIVAERGRHIRAGALKSGVRALRTLRATGFSPNCFVVALGTNDIEFSTLTSRYTEWLTEMLTEIGDFPVVWVNIAHGRLTTRAQAFNSVVASQKTAYPKLVIADWATRAAQHPEWVVFDKVHLRRAGYQDRAHWLAGEIFAGLFAATAPTVLPACGVTKRLRQGMTGDEVTCLEIRLEHLGFALPGGPNRTFDAVTYRAVARFQRRHWLAPTGVVGPATLFALGLSASTSPTP